MILAGLETSWESLDIDKILRVFPKVFEAVKKLENIQNYVYRNQKLAIAAIFHRSALVYWPKDKSGLFSNEKLEFIGDSFLNFVVTLKLAETYPTYSEGQLSKMRSSIVGTQNLVLRAQALGLGECLLLGSGELESARYSKHNLLADVFEATLASLLLDAGEDLARAWILKNVNADIEAAGSSLAQLDAKSRLQEWLQSFANVTPTYKVVTEKLDAAEPEFEMALCINDIEFARAKGRNKREASRLAAEDLMARIESGHVTRDNVLHARNP